jgi:myo-inositol-hexaphosphate 3-phosphohydrolase
MNNVDQRSFPVGDRKTVLVAAAERARFGVMTWLLDPATLRLERWGFLPTDKAFGEPYGFCMGQFGGETFLIPNNKDGVVQAYAVTAGADGKPAMALRHQWKLATQTEGCVVDDATGDLYVGEEDAGIWLMSLADPKRAPVAVAKVDGQRLVADTEGLTILRDGATSYLIASSQGDSAYPVWELPHRGWRDRPGDPDRRPGCLVGPDRGLSARRDCGARPLRRRGAEGPAGCDLRQRHQAAELQDGGLARGEGGTGTALSDSGIC